MRFYFHRTGEHPFYGSNGRGLPAGRQGPKSDGMIHRSFDKVIGLFTGSINVAGFVNIYLNKDEKSMYTNGVYETKYDAITAGNSNGDYICTIKIRDEDIMPQVPPSEDNDAKTPRST